MSSRQIQRVSEYYGNQIEQEMEEYNPEVLPQIPIKDKNDYSYVMVDESMLFTRENKWMGIKVGRIFSQSQVVEIQEDRAEIQRSVYVCHLGKSDQFFIKLERYILKYRNLVFIADGAAWIWKWVEDNYPGAIQVLDFFHAFEKLGKFSVMYLANEQKRQRWLEEQKIKLLENGVDQVITEIKSIRSTNQQVKEAKEKIVRYFEEHEDRMQYKTYRQLGLMIGSGPIEAAHRTVVQQRLKLSGQRWSINGAQRIANLRAMEKSNNWPCILNLIKNAA